MSRTDMILFFIESTEKRNEKLAQKTKKKKYV